jgi:hypothetical protein
VTSDERKKCTKCGLVKPLTAFNKHTRRKDGLQVWCKECKAVINAKWVAANPAKVLLSNARSNTKVRNARFEKAEAKQAAYELACANDPIRKVCTKCGVEKASLAFHKQASNKDGLQSYCKECKADNNAKWVAANPAKVLLKSARSHTKRRNKRGRGHDPVTINEAWVEDRHKKQGGLCYWTGIRYNWASGGDHDPYQVSLDRLDPAKGYSPDNVVLTTDLANRLRGELNQHETELLFMSLGPALMNLYHPKGLQTTPIAPVSASCGDCGRSLPANCPGPGGLCVKTHEPCPIGICKKVVDTVGGP